jgi:biotin transport system substrate-specific component
MQISTRNRTLVALFAALTAIGAWIQIPISPVPFTFQVLFVLLAGVMLGSRYGALSQIVYVLLGLVGLPVFAGGTSGPGILFGPTGGYLFGFVFGAYLIGKFCEVLKPTFLSFFISMVSGIIFIYLLGMVQLAVVANLSLVQAFFAGVLPFIGFDLLKTLIAAFIAVRLHTLGIIPAENSWEQPAS